MATALVTAGSRHGPVTMCSGTKTLEAVDAAWGEYFYLPDGFGHMLIQHLDFIVSSMSGVYVAPAPAYDGLYAYIMGSDEVTLQDSIGSGRFVNIGGTATTPQLCVSFEYYSFPLLRQGERVAMAAPPIGGAGVTATVACRVRGIRFYSN